MERARFLRILREALEAITEPRFFATERGFQGELLAELRARLHEAYFPGDPVVEQGVSEADAGARYQDSAGPDRAYPRLSAASHGFAATGTSSRSKSNGTSMMCLRRLRIWR